jgi:hypothetical protein
MQTTSEIKKDKDTNSLLVMQIDPFRPKAIQVNA